MYPQAAVLGISYESYWEMEPVEVIKVAEAKNKDLVEKANRDLSLAWLGASLQAIAVNNPKKFPKEAPKVEVDEKKIEKEKEVSNQILAYKLEAMYRSGNYS